MHLSTLIKRNGRRRMIIALRWIMMQEGNPILGIAAAMLAVCASGAVGPTLGIFQGQTDIEDAFQGAPHDAP
jgi:hypothetical protein